jgi:hypothetical protein
VSADVRWKHADSLTDALEGCTGFVLSPRAVIKAFRDDSLTRVSHPKGSNPSKGIVASESEDPAGFYVETQVK